MTLDRLAGFVVPAAIVSFPVFLHTLGLSLYSVGMGALLVLIAVFTRPPVT